MLASFALLMAGLAAGVVSMWLYQRSSPQDRIAELMAQSVSLQQQMQAYDGDFDGMLKLSRENLQVSLRRLGYAIGPSLLAGLPVIALLWVIGETSLSQHEFMSVGPTWVRSWLMLFMVATTVSALAYKSAFRVR